MVQLETILRDDFVESLAETMKDVRGNTDTNTNLLSISYSQDATKRQFGLETSQKDLPFVFIRIVFEQRTQAKPVKDAFAKFAKEYFESKGHDVNHDIVICSDQSELKRSFREHAFFPRQFFESNPGPPGLRVNF